MSMPYTLLPYLTSYHLSKQNIQLRGLLQYFSNVLACAAVQIEKKQHDKILSYIEHGKREGATLLTGGKPLGEKGYYIEPTIFTDVKVSTLYFP